MQGLYSYESHTRIDFKNKNLIVGTNDSGKSSIFKAINFFLKSLTVYGCGNEIPWKSQLTHTMKIGFTLDQLETRYLLELLSVIQTERNTHRLTTYDSNAHLNEHFRNIILTIVWKNTPFQERVIDLEYYLDIPDLKLQIRSPSFGTTAIMVQNTANLSNFIYSNIKQSFGELLEDTNPFSLESFLEKIPVEQKKEAILIIPYPTPTKFSDRNGAGIDSSTTVRINFVFESAGIHPDVNIDYGFFQMLGNFLRKRIALISDNRNFQNFSTLEPNPFYNDGSNLQSFLFWLRNGDNQIDKKRYELIKQEFDKVFKNQNLTFDLKIVPTEITNVEPGSEERKSLPEKATIIFYDKLHDLHSNDFFSVGAGVRESLFLLAKYFGHEGGIILMDEPALNLHPLQIQQLMRRIFSHNDSTTNSNQIMIITHSPVLGSMDMLSSVNEIIRVQKIADTSTVKQATEEDRKWLKENLATFHLLKSEVLFAKCVILVEGQSDRIFLETILKHNEKLGIPESDIFILEVGGKKSFSKFVRFLTIFDIPYLILADNDAQNRFEEEAIVRLSPDMDLNFTLNSKDTYVLNKDLEDYFKSIKPDLFNRIDSKYERKPEKAYHFISELLQDGVPEGLKPIAFMLNHALKLTQPDEA